MNLLSSDVRYALRRWARRPAFAATAVLILALGIGATTAVFSIVDAVLLRKLPWPSADRLVVIHAVLPERRSDPAFVTTWNRAPISWAAWRDLRRTSAFEDVGVWYPRQQILGHARTELVEVMYTSSSFLSLLGVQPTLGRVFTSEEDHTESDAVMLSHEAWQRHFGGGSDVLGRTVVLAPTPDSPGVPKTVVGVLPPRFRFREQVPEFLLPMGLMAWNGSFESNRFLRAIGRLAPGVSLDAAFTVAGPLVRRLDVPERRSARVISLASIRCWRCASRLCDGVIGQTTGQSTDSCGFRLLGGREVALAAARR